MATYVVTGGAGFIGSHIVHALVAGNHTVRVIDNFTTGKLANIESLKNDVEILSIDIGETSDLREAFRGVDYVIHQAAIPSVPRSIKDPVGSHRANVDGTLNVLVSARESGVK